MGDSGAHRELRAVTLPHPAGLALWGPADPRRDRLSRVPEDHVPLKLRCALQLICLVPSSASPISGLGSLIP